MKNKTLTIFLIILLSIIVISIITIMILLMNNKINFKMFNSYKGVSEKLEIEETYIEEQINKRAEAKKNRDFEQADKIRSELDEKGIILMDSKEGTTWNVKALYSIN